MTKSFFKLLLLLFAMTLSFAVVSKVYGEVDKSDKLGSSRSSGAKGGKDSLSEGNREEGTVKTGSEEGQEGADSGGDRRDDADETNGEGKESNGDSDGDSYPGVEWTIYAGLRFNLLKNGLDFVSSPPAFTELQFGPSLLLGFEFTGNISENFSLYSSVDMGELSATWSSTAGSETIFGFYLNGYDFTTSPEDLEAQRAAVEYCKEQAKKQGVSTLECEDPPFLLQESLFIRELYAQFSFGPENSLSLKVGMLNSVLGNALILDNYVIGLRFRYDRLESEGFPFALTFDAFLPDSSFTYEGKKSPTLQFRFDFRPVKSLKLGFFTAYLYDGNNLSAKLLLPLWQELYAQYINSSIQKKLQSRGISAQTHFSCDQVNAPRETTFNPRSPKTVTLEELKAFRSDLDKQSFAQGDIDTLAKVYSAGNQKVMVPLFLASFIDLCSTIPFSSGNHLWFGLDWKWKFRDKFEVEGSAIFYFSKFSVGKPTGALIFRRKVPKSRFRPGSYSSRNRSAGAYSRFSRYKNSRRNKKRRSPLTVENFDSIGSFPQSTGDLTVENSIPRVELTGLGFAGEIQFTYYWPYHIETGLFFVTASGDRFTSRKDTIYSFMGISPQLRYTDLFFSGGINSYSSKRGIGISGIAGTGYLSPGITVQVSGEYPDEVERFSLVLTAAAFWSYYPPPYGVEGTKPGKFYGGEVNIIGNYNFRISKKFERWFTISPTFQLDFFFPGDFFAPSSPPAVVVQFLAGLDLSW